MSLLLFPSSTRLSSWQRLRHNNTTTTLARRQATVAHRHSAGGGRPPEDRKPSMTERKMEGQTDRSVAPIAHHRHHHYLRRRSLLLPLVLLGVAATTLGLRGGLCDGVDSAKTGPSANNGGDDDDVLGWTGGDGFLIETSFMSGHSAIDPLLHGGGRWLVVRIEPTRRARWWKWPWLKMGRRATKPRRDNRLQTASLEVFRMTCYALDRRKARGSRLEGGDSNRVDGAAAAQPNTTTHLDVPVDAHMNHCHEQIEDFEGREFVFTRYTYEIAEHHRTWINGYLQRRREEHQLNDFAALSVYYNCQQPSERHRDGIATECHGNTISEFHPALLRQYNYNTLLVDYQPEGDEPDDLAERKATPQNEVSGSVIVRWDSVLKLTGSSAEVAGKVFAIQTRGLSQPVLLAESEKSSTVTTIRVIPQEVQLEVEGDEDEEFVAFYVQDKWNSNHVFNINRKFPVKFTSLSVPEIYSYAPKGVRQQNGRGVVGTTVSKLDPGPIIVIRLRRRGWFFFWSRGRFKREGGENVYTASCGATFQSVAKCLWQWKAEKVSKLFIAVDNIASLESFVYDVEERPLQLPFDTALVPDVTEWNYVLEGGLTGGIKVAFRENGSSGRIKPFGVMKSANDSEQMQMLGVMESPVLRTKFFVPLWQSYVPVAAALLDIRLKKQGEWSERYSCPGGLRLTFNAASRDVRFMEIANDSEQWSNVLYWGTSRMVQVIVSLTERFFIDGETRKQVKLFPPNWQGLHIRRRMTTDPAQQNDRLFTNGAFCGNERKKRKKRQKFRHALRRADELKVHFRPPVTLLSPPVVDDVNGHPYRQYKTKGH